MSRTLTLAGRYRLIEPIGAGGMGELFLAQREGSPELCVVKRLLGEMKQHDHVADRFLREAQIATLLDHPGIARTIDAGFDGDDFYIAMELIPGVDLYQLGSAFAVNAEPLPFELAVTVMMRSLEALAYAHDARGPEGEPLSIVHRDLSPKNVMISFDGRVKIIDFGVARANVGEFKTKAGMLVGSLRYLSPEQARAKPIDHRSDLYTLSVVIHEVLAGRAVIEEEELAPALRAIVTREVAPIRHLRPEVPEDLAYVLERGLAKERDKRWQSATEYLEALNRAMPTSDLGEEKLGAVVRELFPDREQSARARMEQARLRFDLESSNPPDHFAATKTRAPRPAPKTQTIARPRSRSLLWIAPMLLFFGAIIGATMLISRPPDPPVQPIMEVERAPTIVPRTDRPEVEPVVEEKEEPAPRKPVQRIAPPPKGLDLDAELASRGLARVDLEHQHELDPLLWQISSKNPETARKAIANLVSQLDRIEFSGDQLRRRLGESSALLKVAEERLPQREFRELERSFMDIATAIEASPSRPRYRELCAQIDALERKLR